MNISVNNQRMYQYSPAVSHIVTDQEETMKLLQKKCGYVTPWSMEEKQDIQDKTKQVPVQKDLKKIDLYL